jgi:hypothetical protein
MTKKKSTQPPPEKVAIAWGIYNWGRLYDLQHRKRDAINSAESISGKPWKECKAYFCVAKVKVTTL